MDWVVGLWCCVEMYELYLEFVMVIVDGGLLIDVFLLGKIYLIVFVVEILKFI